MINLNPISQAEEDLAKIFLAAMLQLSREKEKELTDQVMDVIKRTVKRERFLIEAHPDCGAENPEGLAAKCQCHCHQGHYRHMWTPVIKTPVLNPDGTYHMIDRCKYCPDIRFKIIKSAWVGDHNELVSQEFLIRGESRVLTAEEWFTKKPEKLPPEELREVKL